MNYSLLKQLIDLLAQFESENIQKSYSEDIQGFKEWIIDASEPDLTFIEPDWEGKQNGRSPESVISTLLVHMNRFAKAYSKAAIWNSEFSTQEDFIFLINLKAFGEMTKMELIKKNVQEKPAGMLIINRLIAKGWVEQKNSDADKRSKVIRITDKGLADLEKQMDKIRQATKIVTGDLNYSEKMELIRLLNKLNNFHQEIYDKSIETEKLLEIATNSLN